MPNGAGGGGGGGIVGVSNSFTGPAQALELVGDHCFAFSGAFGSNTSAQTMFSFTSGNYYVDGMLQCNGFTDLDNIGGGSLGAFELKFNGATVAILKITGSAETAPYSVNQPIVIPSYTEVLLTCISSNTDSAFEATASLTGRIYRG